MTALQITGATSAIVGFCGPSLPFFEHPLVAAVLLLTLMATSLAIALSVLVNLPADYLIVARGHDLTHVREGALACGCVVLRNLLGAVLVAVGLLLAIPGVPGQGLLTILAGLLLVDFPGKRRLLVTLLRRPLVETAVNRVRAKWSRPPLVVEATRKPGTQKAIRSESPAGAAAIPSKIERRAP